MVSRRYSLIFLLRIGELITVVGSVVSLGHQCMDHFYLLMTSLLICSICTAFLISFPQFSTYSWSFWSLFHLNEMHSILVSRPFLCEYRFLSSISYLCVLFLKAGIFEFCELIQANYRVWLCLFPQWVSVRMSIKALWQQWPQLLGFFIMSLLSFSTMTYYFILGDYKHNWSFRWYKPVRSWEERKE